MKPNWFVAFPVLAQGWLADIQANAPEGLRWFVPTDVHLTLAFLGAMEPGLQEAVCTQMQAVRHEPVSIRLKELIALPSERNFSAISLKVSQGNEVMSQLMQQWRGVFYKTALARPDDRPPLPHITIARPQKELSYVQRAAILDWVHTCPIPDVELIISQIALYTWAANRQLQQFRIVASHPLAEP